MKVGIAFDNLGELADELRRLPDQVQGAASGVVVGAARAFASVMGVSFPARSRSGAMRAALQLEVVNELRAVVQNTAAGAGPLEGGFLHATADRWIEGQNIWVPEAMRTRNEMIAQLRAIVDRGRGLRLRALEVTA